MNVPDVPRESKQRDPLGLNENFRYALREEAAVEDFEDGSLIFICDTRRVIHINVSARHLIDLMDGRRNLRESIDALSTTYSVEKDIARHDALELVKELISAGAVRADVRLNFQEKLEMDESSYFLANPEVSVREEDGDGAILFNADSNALMIINPVGLIIWRHIRPYPRTRADIVDHLQQMCEGVPKDQAAADVEAFLKDLLAKGFVGEVMDES